MLDEDYLRAAAIVIGDDIIKSRKDWVLLHRENENDDVFDCLSIYNGISGELLFIIELYRNTSNPHYIPILNSAGESLVRHIDTNKGDNNSLMFGRAGIALTFLELYKVTSNFLFYKKSTELLKIISFDLIKCRTKDYSFFGGKAGILWVFLQYYKIKQEKWVDFVIKESIQDFIRAIKINHVGFCWPYEKKSINPICGYAYGNSGIALVFFQLGKYFALESFNFIATQAIRYEDFLWNGQKRSWPDFRKEILNVTLQKTHFYNYRCNNLKFFSSPDFNTTYEHGLSGILITRILSGFYSHDVFTSDKIQKALKHLIGKMKHIDFEHCNVLDLLGEALALSLGRYVLEGKERDAIEGILRNLIESVKINGLVSHSNNSLFGGKAGLGIFLLSVLHKSNYSNILLPGDDSPVLINNYDRQKTLAIFSPEILLQVLKNNYPRSFYLLHKYYYGHFFKFISSFSSFDLKSISDSYFEFINHLVSSLSPPAQKIIQDVLCLERARFEIIKKNKSEAFLNIKQIVKDRFKLYLNDLNRNELINLRLVLDKESIKIVETKWNWNENIGLKFCRTKNLIDFSDEPSFFYTMIILESHDVITEIYLSNEQYFLLGIFNDEILIENAIVKFVAAFGLSENDKMNADKLRNLAFNLITKYIFLGALIKCGKL